MEDPAEKQLNNHDLSPGQTPEWFSLLT